MVLLGSSKNLKLSTNGTKKLLPKWIGPFRIAKGVGLVVYKLELPTSMKCHPVFHVSNLQPYRSNGCVQPPRMPIEVHCKLEYEVEQIILHRDVRINRHCSKHEYLIKSLGLALSATLGGRRPT